MGIKSLSKSKSNKNYEVDGLIFPLVKISLRQKK